MLGSQMSNQRERFWIVSQSYKEKPQMGHPERLLAGGALKERQEAQQIFLWVAYLRLFWSYLGYRSVVVGRLVISDVGGTITRSDLLGHMLPAQIKHE